jgi:UDP-2,4-diacetamido-2,4,6-trideoxy-beta-L-altropyranose hydrolase
MSSLQVAFRVDASQQIGTGHVVRCLTLAMGLAKQGANITFVSRHMPDYLQELITSQGFSLSILSGDGQQLDGLSHANWLETSQQQDADETISILANSAWDWLIVDHYALDIRWEKALRSSVKKIMVIDDIADRNHDCDILLDQNYYVDMDVRYKNKVPADCHILVGPKYALLRDEFIEARKIIKSKDGVVKRILVFFGGVDAQNFTGLAIDSISTLKEYQFDVDVVIGASHPNKDEIINSCKLNGYLLHIQTQKIAQLMADADLTIGAGGSATWEKCCLGLPSIVIATANNQVKQLNDLAASGYCYLIEHNNELVDTLKLHIKAIVENKALRHFLANNSATLVDGVGTQRLVKLLLSSSSLQLRGVTAADEKNIFDWRNHSNIRAVSVNKDVIAWESHQAWFKNMLQNTNVVMLIAELDKAPVGVVRFDVNQEEAEVSIYLIQQTESNGLGYSVLIIAEQWLMKMCLSLKEFNATVLEDNSASHLLFKKAGYQLAKSHYIKVIH